MRGDPIQLQQVVLNLVMNGIDAVRTATKGTRRVTGSTTRLDDTTAELSILDTGPGIPRDKLKRIYSILSLRRRTMGWAWD